MKYYYLTIPCLMFITACGGGTAEPSSSQTIITPAPKTATQTADLKTDEVFDFRSDYQLQVILSVKPADAMSYFVNVCSDYNNAEPVITDYSSCKIRGHLVNKQQSFELELGETERKMVAQIWPMFDGAEPKTIYYEANNGNQPWVISY